MKNYQLQIRVSEAQKAQIKNHAKKAGLDVSSWVLSCILPTKTTQLQKLVDRLEQSSEKNFSLILSEINDFLVKENCETLLQSTSSLEIEKLDDFLANYLAAMIELRAYQLKIDPPKWTASTKPLKKPYFSTSLKNLLPHLLVHSPLPFRRRNLFIDASVGDQI